MRRSTEVGVADSSTGVSVVVTTTPDAGSAELLGRRLVDERLAACASVIPGVTSIYRWEGAIRQEGEVVMLLKTTSGAVGALRDRLLELHPYDVPEVVALPVEAGHDAYLDWVRQQVGAG